MEPARVLTKQENGNYGFESVLKEHVAKSEKIAVAATGLHYELPTTEPGNYIFELRDDQNRRLSKMPFAVVGRGTVARSLEKNSELEVKLDRAQYNTGDEIAISITAPYAGSGLITIERDKEKIRLVTRYTLKKREEVITARIQGELAKDAKDIVIVSRTVASLQLTIPPEWAPATVNWNGNMVSTPQNAGCYILSLKQPGAIRPCP